MNKMNLPVVICFECGKQMWYQSYIDVDDGQGERLVCNDCYETVASRGLFYVEPDSEQPLDSRHHFAYTDLPLDCPGCDMGNESTGGEILGTLDMAGGSEGSEEDCSRDPSASAYT